MPAELIAATQLVDVVMTLEDINGQLWNNAKVLINFVAPPNTSGPYTWNGGEFQQSYRWEKLAGSSIQVQLQPNMEIVPEGWNSYWRFDVAPNADDSRSVSFLVQVAGPAMDLTPSFTAASEQIIQKLVQSFPVPRAKSDVDVAPAPNDGQIYFDTTTQEMKYRSLGAWVEFGTGAGQEGPAGPQGPTGMQGIPGPQGIPGNTGPQGPKGETGATGPAGQDGKSVTILGSYDTIEDLIAAHPTGNLGDAYMVGADMYVWNGTEWYNVGTIQGPEGPTGPMGPPGATGSTGPQGPIGNTGPQGVPGNPGATGPIGPIGPPGPTIYPAAGVAVSTGSAWGTSIPANTLATTAQLAGYLPLTGGNITGNLGVSGAIAGAFITSSGNISADGSVTGATIVSLGDISATGQITSASMGVTGTLTAGAINSSSTIGAAGTVFAAALGITGDVNIGNNVNVNGYITSPAALFGEVSANGWQAWNNANTLATIGINQTSGEPQLRLFNRNVFWTQTNAAITVDGSGNLVFRSGNDANSFPYTWMYMSRDSSGAPIQVVTTCGASISGDLYVGGAKNFRITHPLDPTKDLVHSVVEGPECSVFYRGESITDGYSVEITLPDYFEALTLEEDRTVQLTPLTEWDTEPFGCLAASRVKDGKFKVRSQEQDQKFYWEVKAVRKDIPKLVVERTKEEVANATSSNREAGKQAAAE